MSDGGLTEEATEFLSFWKQYFTQDFQINMEQFARTAYAVALQAAAQIPGGSFLFQIFKAFVDGAVTGAEAVRSQHESDPPSTAEAAISAFVGEYVGRALNEMGAAAEAGLKSALSTAEASLAGAQAAAGVAKANLSSAQQAASQAASAAQQAEAQAAQAAASASTTAEYEAAMQLQQTAQNLQQAASTAQNAVAPLQTAVDEAVATEAAAVTEAGEAQAALDASPSLIAGAAEGLVIAVEIGVVQAALRAVIKSAQEATYYAWLDDNDDPKNPHPGNPPSFGDPLVLDLSGAGINLTALSGSPAHFDYTGSGIPVETAWIGAGQGLR